MDKFIRIFEFAQQLFPDEHTAHQASEIIEGIMNARSPRLSDIAARTADNEEAESVIAEPTEVERPHAVHRVCRPSRIENSGS